MNIITPDSNYTIDIEKYKSKLQSLKPGSRVLISRSNPAAIAESLIGNWELNLVSIPIDPLNTSQATWDYILQDCDPHAIVYDSMAAFIDELNPSKLSSTDDHAIFYTSGTTGNPKGVLQTRRGMESNARAVAKLHEFSQTSVHLTALPLYHCNAAAMSLFGNYFTGGTAIFLNKFSPESYFNNINKYKATTANLVPTMVNDLADSGLPWPQSLKYVLTAATALGQEISKKFYKAYGPKLRQGYGLSEGINFSFTMPLLDGQSFVHEMVEQYPPVGLLVQGEFRIQDGEVQLRGENILEKYWNNREATTAAFTDDGWFKTGDRGELRNGYLVLTGRFKEIIIKGGENYSPVMLEDEYRRAGIVGDIAIVSSSDKRLGEDIALIAETYQVVELTNKKLQPAAVRYGSVQRTQTRKPQRGIMSQGLVSLSVPDRGYHSTLGAAGNIAKRILRLIPTNAQQEYLYNIAKKLEQYADNTKPYKSVEPYFEAINSNLESWWNNKLDKHIFNGLDWSSLMNNTPMGGYPELANEFCIANNLYSNSLLEVGAGVGNFSKFVPNSTEYIRTDINKKFLTGNYTQEFELDINNPYAYNNIYSVVGINVMHCAKDKIAAITHAYKAIKPGGILLLGEGQAPGDVWALDILFGFIDGWHDRGGFINRHEWLSIFNKLPNQEIGYSVYREGRYDLGGLVWIKKNV